MDLYKRLSINEAHDVCNRIDEVFSRIQKIYRPSFFWRKRMDESTFTLLQNFEDILYNLNYGTPCVFDEVSRPISPDKLDMTVWHRSIASSYRINEFLKHFKCNSRKCQRQN